MYQLLILGGKSLLLVSLSLLARFGEPTAGAGDEDPCTGRGKRDTDSAGLLAIRAMERADALRARACH